jgi:hypothetical protein
VSDLERALAVVGSEIEYPPTPALAAGVRARVEAAPVPARRLSLRPRRSLAVALAALLLIAGSAVAAVPSLRHSVLDWLGLRSVKIERAPRLPTAGAAGADLGLGKRVTLVDGRAPGASFRVLVPSKLVPDAVYAGEGPPGGQVALAYRSRRGLPSVAGSGVGLLITEFRGEQSRLFLQKTLGPGTTAEDVTVGGERGIWIAGAPHIVIYRDAAGRIRDETLRLATNTLLFRHGELLVRLEAHISKAAALRVASSMR